MDFTFPDQLFPSFYKCGPPNEVLNPCAGSWGSYDKLRIQDDSGSRSNWTFTSRHQVTGETWRQTEPVPLPLLSPKHAFLWPTEPPNPLGYMEHMQNFFMDHRRDAFGCMSEILGKNFIFGKSMKKTGSGINMWRLKSYLDGLATKKCRLIHRSSTLEQYSFLLGDVVHSVPPQLLGSLLYEELTEQRERLLFSEAATGGALDFIPFSHSGDGYLIYPGNQGLDRLRFLRVELQRHRGRPSVLTSSTSDSFSFPLNGPIRQISSASLFDNSCVAVRSDYLCGAWRFSEAEPPRLLQAVNTREVATCVSASPHVLGEVLVASESGVVNLWTVGRGMQEVRREDGNLHFNAESPWRWCDFSAHPRVMVYADRTGAELTDIRVSPVSARSLFSISRSSDCRSGERLVLSKYLGDVHSFHHLVTTQFSSYIVDERLPGVPMLKWDHMMESPPLFCHVLPGSASSGSVAGGAGTTKVVLGSQRSQELVLLQYSGGGATACSSRGPPLGLLRPNNSLKHLPVQIPHRLDVATHRLSSSAAGLTCVQRTAADGGDICVLQLTEAGDVFYQILEQQIHDDTSPPSAAADVQPSKPATWSSQGAREAAENSWSDGEDAIGPTQDQTVPTFVAETPEREQQTFSHSEEEESEEEGRRRRTLRQLKLQVIVNESGDDGGGDSDDSDAPEKGGERADSKKELGPEKESICSSTKVSAPREEKMSEEALVAWKRWLQKLVKKPRPPRSQLVTVNTEGFLRLRRDETRVSSEDERVRSLRRDLRTCMSKRLLLQHDASSPPEPLPNAVDTDAWTDPLSRRLTASWQGEGAWKAWWEEELGLNRAEKEKSLRRKRRREKEMKRAAGRMELSGSFTSSTNYQTDLDSFSDLSGWTSGSQGAWSDTDGLVDIAMSASPVTSPQRIGDEHDELQTPSGSHDVSVSQTPSGSHDVSVSQTPSGSHDVFTSQTPSGSHDIFTSQTPSGSHDVFTSQTPSGSHDVFTSQTPSGSHDIFTSQTPSGSHDVFTSQTPSGSHDIFTSQTPSGSHDIFTSQTPSRSHDVFTSQTPSGSHDIFTLQKPSGSHDVFTSQTPSGSHDIFTSQTPSRSHDVFTSQTPSGSHDVFTSQTPSGSHDIFTSQTPSGSHDVFTSQTPSGSHDIFTSQTPSGSHDIFTSQTPSRSHDVFTSQTPSGSHDIFTLQKPSGSHDVFTSQTPSGSHDVFTSQTPSRSHDVFTSQTPSGSHDVFTSQTPSGSHDVFTSQTPSGSHDVFTSQTPSGSHDVSVSQTPSGSHDVSVSQTANATNMEATRRAMKRPAEGDHTSVFASQVKPSLKDNSGQRSPVPLRDDSAVWSGFFRSRPLSRGHAGPSLRSQSSLRSQTSLSSQTRKKKPRMGF